MYAVTLSRVAGTVINGVHPTSESRRIRLAAEEIDVLLAHEEVRVVDRIRAVAAVVVLDGHGRSGLRAQRRAGSTAETDCESLISFRIRVIDYGYREGLRSLARTEL